MNDLWCVFRKGVIKVKQFFKRVMLLIAVAFMFVTSVNVSSAYATETYIDRFKSKDNIYDDVKRYTEVYVRSDDQGNPLVNGPVEWYLYKPNGELYDRGTVYPGESFQ
jgi:hypothetical protein